MRPQDASYNSQLEVREVCTTKRGNSCRFDNTVAPVVVKPETDSKIALTGVN